MAARARATAPPTIVVAGTGEERERERERERELKQQIRGHIDTEKQATATPSGSPCCLHHGQAPGSLAWSVSVCRMVREWV